MWLVLASQAAQADSPELNILGPRPGYSLQVGTFVSTLTWMRDANGVVAATKDLTQADLDALFDKNVNSIGALMLPTNNYCKWFHVCEHEAHHSGQIALLRKRLPGAKPDAA